MQRLYAYLLVLRYVQLLAKYESPSPLGGEGGGEGEETKTYAYIYDNEDVILEYLTKTEDGETKTDTTRYIHGPGIDEPLAIERKREVYYYHADGLGSIVTLTDSKGKVVQTYEYDSFGNVKQHGDKVKQPDTYTGREWDKEIGTYNYRWRTYDQKAGRFITKDPSLYLSGSPEIPYLLPFLLATPQELNPYLYTRNNPVNLTDPEGLLAPSTLFFTFLLYQEFKYLVEQGSTICLNLQNNQEMYLPIPLLVRTNNGALTGGFIKIEKDCEGKCHTSIYVGTVKAVDL